MTLHTVSPYTSVRLSPSNAVFYNGDSVNLTCLAQGGPGNIYHWTFNGTLINIQSDHLLLPFITAGESGGYYACRVSNAAGSDSNITAVCVYPTLTLHPNDTFVTPDQNGVLTCEASAFPSPLYNWLRLDGAAIPLASADTNMLILNTTFGDHGPDGVYVCTATANNLTVMSDSATVYGE